MKLQVFGVLLLVAACFASAGQGIDEEKVDPYWEEPEPETEEGEGDSSSSSEDNDDQTPIIPPEWEPRNMIAAEEVILIKLNKGVDKVLGFIEEGFHTIGLDAIELPDISKPFGHSPYGGTFKASKGYFRNPASLQRTGDVEIIVKNKTTITLQVQLGFKEAEVIFNQYNLDVLNIHHEGNITISVDQNSLKFKFTITYAPQCHFQLENLEFDKLTGIKINISGLGIFQTMFNELSYWLINNFESTFRQIINHKLFTVADNALHKKDICKYFPQ